MNKDNKGVTLVELMVVIAIMVVLSSIVFLGAGMLSGKKARECTDRLKIALTNDRTTAMGKYDMVAILYAEADGTIFLEEQIYNTATDIVTKRTRIGDSSVAVTYSNDGTEPVNALTSSGVTIRFDRSTGGLKDTTGSLWVKASKAGRSYYLHVYQITGKIEVVEEFTAD